MFPNLPPDQPVAIDSETTGLDYREDFTVGLVLTWGEKPDETAYHPIRHEGGGNLDSEPVLKFYKELLNSPSRRVVMHHAAFDLDFLANDGIEVRGPVEDTGINATLIDENAKKFSLEACCNRAKVQAKKGDVLYAHIASKFGGEAVRGQMEHFHRLRGDDPYAVDYAAGDGTSTYQLWKAQQPILDNQALRKVWEVEGRLIKVLHRSKRLGVRVDEERLADVKAKVVKLRDEAQAVIGEVNPRSAISVRKYLETLGDSIPAWPITAKGNPSFPEKYLATFKEGRAIVRVRKFANLLNTFIGPLYSEHIWQGRVHASFQQTASDDYGTVTGRLSSYRPNMQQIPKRNKELGRMFRSVFIPDEGMIWDDCDWSQAEYRIFVHYAQIKRLIDGYNEGTVDIHDYVAELCNVERDPVAKSINFGVLYGMGPRTLAATLGVSVARSKEILGIYADRIPEARRFAKSAEGVAAQRGYIFSLLGRRRRFPDRRFAYKAVNAICQSGNADATKLKMCELSDFFEEEGIGNLFFSIHDSFSMQRPKDRRDILERAIAILEDFGPNAAIPLDVKMRCDVGTGETWAEATYGTN